MPALKDNASAVLVDRLAANLNRLPNELLIKILHYSLQPFSPDEMMIELCTFEKEISSTFQMILATPCLRAVLMMESKWLIESFNSFKADRIDLGFYADLTKIAAKASLKPIFDLDDFNRLKGLSGLDERCTVLRKLVSPDWNSLPYDKFFDLYYEASAISYAVLELTETAPSLCACLIDDFIPTRKQFPSASDRAMVVINRAMRTVQHLQLYVAVREWLSGHPVHDDLIEEFMVRTLVRSGKVTTEKDLAYTMALIVFFRTVHLSEQTRRTLKGVGSNGKVPSPSRHVYTIIASPVVQALFSKINAPPLTSAGETASMVYRDLASKIQLDKASYIRRIPIDQSHWIWSIHAHNPVMRPTRFHEIGEPFCAVNNLQNKSAPGPRQPCIHEYFERTSNSDRLVLGTSLIHIEPLPPKKHVGWRKRDRREEKQRYRQHDLIHSWLLRANEESALRRFYYTLHRGRGSRAEVSRSSSSAFLHRITKAQITSDGRAQRILSIGSAVGAGVMLYCLITVAKGFKKGLEGFDIWTEEDQMPGGC
ncbi:hypothetical protein BT63DRAFT_411949 [Microthyrium microscopicum]|uniref:Uncharacterized protein n=1 Tax=Microthyrium microscopicum TaxID=703497 RepID=A0A6A6UH29_9PEZI|nr:hypothetical protein BT63DRAFT_411949 [Microthyrium microscopicum]